YIVAESGAVLGTVHTLKENHRTNYIGTDIGFNVLARPMLYDSHHDIEIYKKYGVPEENFRKATVVGNICESGDILAKDRLLPEIAEGDIIGIMDAGAYGYCMSSNYNSRLRPAEVLITAEGRDVLIRRRDTLDDLMRNYIL
ncbi:MAG TPA: diaminopimelate decarboxylase, partial [Clostridia bacterium]|nr:diaminopimelate decarboxylase [Clostridia bacterium]